MLDGVARWTLAGTIALLATLSWPGYGTAQVVYDPAIGFLTPNLREPAPILGTTDTLPPFPTTGLGFAGAPASYTGLGFGAGGVGGGGVGGFGGGARVAPAEPAVAPSRLIAGNPLLPSIAPGAQPFQAGDDRAPWLIIRPSIGIATGFDDNPRQLPNREADSVTQFGTGLSVSADSPHFQGLLASSIDYFKYARASDQDTLMVNGVAYGLATISPGHLYVDGRASMFQVSPTGGGGFVNPQFNSLNQPQTVLTTSVTPVWREAFGDLIETDLRYNHSTVSSLSSLSQNGPTLPAEGVADTELNQGTLTVALGRGGGVLASRVRLSAADIASQSDAASTQVRGVAELQYRISPEIALTAQGGYENLRYPNAGLAFPGPVITAGTRLDPSDSTAINFRYGRENGGWGFNGSVAQALTPRTLLLLSYQHGISSQQEQILSNLNASRLDAYGTIVDAETALPLALANPEFAFAQSGVFRMQQARAALQHEFETDSIRLFAFYEKQTSLVAGTASDQTRGAEFAWFRAMTPQLTGAFNVGIAAHSGSKTISSGASLTYNLRRGVDAFLSYQFQDNISNENGAGSLAVPGSSSFIRNIVLAGIRASF